VRNRTRKEPCGTRISHFWVRGSGRWILRASTNSLSTKRYPSLCRAQQEIDYFWGKLSADAKAEQRGWLKDKYGLSWQISPAVMQELLGGSDRARIDRVTQAFLKMKKFDLAALKRAAAG